jgi:hypothetical protein
MDETTAPIAEPDKLPIYTICRYGGPLTRRFYLRRRDLIIDAAGDGVRRGEECTIAIGATLRSVRRLLPPTVCLQLREDDDLPDLVEIWV